MRISLSFYKKSMHIAQSLYITFLKKKTSRFWQRWSRTFQIQTIAREITSILGMIKVKVQSQMQCDTQFFCCALGIWIEWLKVLSLRENIMFGNKTQVIHHPQLEFLSHALTHDHSIIFLLVSQCSVPSWL